MSRAFPSRTLESDDRISTTTSPLTEDWFVGALPLEAQQTRHPAAHPSLDFRSLLESHRDRVVIAVDWPVIIEAAEFTRLGRHRDLVELDRNHPVQHAGPWTEASVRVGRRQLARLRACRDLRVVQRYLDAVEEGRAQAWNPIVFGVALAAFNLPYRQGLLHYASTVLRGLAEPYRPKNISEGDWADRMNSLETPLPEAAHRLLQPATLTLGKEDRPAR
jgi:hypothetical protein